MPDLRVWMAIVSYVLWGHLRASPALFEPIFADSLHKLLNYCLFTEISCSCGLRHHWWFGTLRNDVVDVNQNLLRCFKTRRKFHNPLLGAFGKWLLLCLIKSLRPPMWLYCFEVFDRTNTLGERWKIRLQVCLLRPWRVLHTLLTKGRTPLRRALHRSLTSGARHSTLRILFESLFVRWSGNLRWRSGPPSCLGSMRNHALLLVLWIDHQRLRICISSRRPWLLLNLENC